MPSHTKRPRPNKTDAGKLSKIQSVSPRSETNLQLSRRSSMSARDASFVLPAVFGLLAAGIFALLGSEFAAGLATFIGGSVALASVLIFSLWTGEVYQRSQRFTRADDPFNYWFSVVSAAFMLGLVVFIGFHWVARHSPQLGLTD